MQARFRHLSPLGAGPAIEQNVPFWAKADSVLPYRSVMRSEADGRATHSDTLGARVPGMPYNGQCFDVPR